MSKDPATTTASSKEIRIGQYRRIRWLTSFRHWTRMACAPSPRTFARTVCAKTSVLYRGKILDGPAVVIAPVRSAGVVPGVTQYAAANTRRIN